MSDKLLSVLVPSRTERFLTQTVNDVLAKASGPIEVVVALDGYWPDPPLPDRKNLRIVHLGRAQGMRACLNAAAAVARGEFVMKTDAHCLFAPGFDEVLKAECDDDWIVIPRRYSLDAENWKILETGKSPVDYHYLSSPQWSIKYRDDYSMHGLEFRERARERKDNPAYDVDETMSFQGSCYFMTRRHLDRLGPLEEGGYGTFAQEPQERGNKTWLGGGRVMTNKKTWYAHLYKGKQYGRMYTQDKPEIAAGHEWSARYWMQNQWPDRIHDLAWLIDRFWPVPDWPADILENWEKYVPDGADLDELKAAALR
jgi:glycosyltransferase involved in cell wall biosynthesis